jgi:hypothetical protein
MNDREIQLVRMFGIAIITIFILNAWTLHRKEDAIREFGMYFQGAVSCNASTPSPTMSAPTFQTTYEN